MERRPARSRRTAPRGFACLIVLAVTLAALASSARAALPTIGGRVEGYGIVRFDQSSPRQRPLARIDLFAEQKVTSELRWKLATTGRWGGTIENASGGGLIDFGHSFQNIDPSLQLDEAWVEWVGRDFEIRAGNQRFTWGKLIFSASRRPGPHPKMWNSFGRALTRLIGIRPKSAVIPAPPFSPASDPSTSLAAWENRCTTRRAGSSPPSTRIITW